MSQAHVLITLALVHFVALLSPGPDFALVVQNASRYGRERGIYIALGLSLGILTHALLSITGISLLVSQHYYWFSIIELLGGSYLLYLGLSALKGLFNQNVSDDSAHLDKALQLENHGQALSKGYLTNILNPKALVFFISLVSTLIPVDFPLIAKAQAVVILWGLSFSWFAALAWLLSSQRVQLKLQRAGRYIDFICSAIFILIGLTILSRTILLVIK
ncbi:LysE family translocator [Celerinatantimonas sp. MCCC 1A17872]|uniref:LysE family translocator n=1 Tax=Celerinatantimonas sp. MCCC 1A17872 TaxID=3177514 RepID=UPI0038C4E8D1